MTDILKSLSVDIHCHQCGDFTLGADVIAESQSHLKKDADTRPLFRWEDDGGAIPTTSARARPWPTPPKCQKDES